MEEEEEEEEEKKERKKSPTVSVISITGHFLVNFFFLVIWGY